MALILKFERGGEGVSSPFCEDDGKRKEAGHSTGLFEFGCLDVESDLRWLRGGT